MTKHTNILTHRIPDTEDDNLVLDLMEGVHFHRHEPGDVLAVLYVEFSGIEDGRRTYNAVNTQYFGLSDLASAFACFNERKASPSPGRATPMVGSLDKALPKKGESKGRHSHRIREQELEKLVRDFLRPQKFGEYEKLVKRAEDFLEQSS